MKVSQVTLLCSATLVAASSGGLDDMAMNEASSPSVVKSQAVESASTADSQPVQFPAGNAIASSASPKIAPPSEAASSVNSKVANSQLVQNSNVVSSSVADGYAVAPSTTITTTDANGKLTTQMLWWIPDATTTPTAAVSGKSVSEPSKATVSNTITASAEKTKTLASSVSILQKSDFSSVPVQSDSATSSHSRRADEPLTTVVTTDANGNTITSKVWWMPSSVYYSKSDSVKASSVASDSANIKDTKKTTIESLYVSSSGSKIETYTKTLTSNIRKAASISNSTSSSENAAAEGYALPNNVIGAGSLVALALALL